MNKRQTMLDPDDRISMLSDALLTYILSFLPTKYAVKMSVLSTRWRPLWLSVPVLKLRYSDFQFDGADDHKSRRKADYLTFVYQFLMHTRQYSLRKVHLDGMRYDLSIIASLISLAKQHKVEELKLESYFHMEPLALDPDNDLPSQDFAMNVDLFLHRLDPMPQAANNLSYSGKLCFHNSIPTSMEVLLSVAREWNVKELDLIAENFVTLREYHQNMFTGNMLVVLKLRKMILNFPRASICFPKLKVLFLTKIVFKNNRSGSNLITSGCPVLEELNVERFSKWDNIKNLTFKSHTLKRLKVRFEPNHCRKHKLKTLIDAPNLRHLDLRDDVTLDYVIGDLSSLVEAELGIWVREKTQYLDKIVYGNNLVTFLRKIRNVEHLSLSDHTLLALQKASSCNLLTFHMLNRLKICFCELESDFVQVSWDLILKLLMSSPNLKHLIWQGALFDFNSTFNSTQEHEVPMCLVWSVETIEIESVWGEEKDIKLPQYFLKNSQSLKTLKVEFLHNTAKTEVIKQAILALPRASATCQIEIGTKKYHKFDAFEV